MRLSRWLQLTLIAVATLMVTAVVALYGASEVLLRRRYPVPGKSLTVPGDSASVAQGERLVTLHGCFGCHAEQGKGQVFFDDPKIATLVAPNLTRAFASYSDAELDGIIRHGIRPNGRSVLAMPSMAFRPLRDEDFARMVAYIRSIPPSDGPGPGIRVGPLGRVGLLTGKFNMGVTLVAEVENAPPVALPDSLVEGSYLAHTICTECHGALLQGDPAFGDPPLAIAATYDWADFQTLMRTGKARGNREVGLMSEVARARFSQFTPEELAALFAYLKTLGTSATASGT